MVNNFKDKKVLVMGLGLHGGALAVVEWLLKNKAQLTITDLKNSQQLKPTLDKLKKLSAYKNIKIVLGRHDSKDFLDQDLIIQNPGVPRNSKYLDIARKQNIPIINEAVMFFGLYDGKTIGVTGTRGKSTTATILHKILASKIKTNVVAGNIATNPMLKVLDKLKKDSWPVLELSSWQLENMEEYGISPDIAVVTNVMIDHLNRYKNFAEYKKAKYAIIKNQKKGDIAVLNYDNVHSKSFAKRSKAKVYFYSLHAKVNGAYYTNDSVYFGATKIFDKNDINIPGDHNISNILAAVTVAKILKIPSANIRKAVRLFQGVDYRLQYKGEVKGIKVYNDSTSTTPDATLVALQAMKGKHLVLLAGGEDKQLDYSHLAKEVFKTADFLVLLAGSGSDKLQAELEKLKFPAYRMVSGIKDLKAAWRLSLKYAYKREGCILFSPGAASFNMFINEFDRARKFDELINGTK